MSKIPVTVWVNSFPEFEELIDLLQERGTYFFIEYPAIRNCSRCDGQFMVGPGTGRRHHHRGGPRYCTPKCQKAAAYQQRVARHA